MPEALPSPAPLVDGLDWRLELESSSEELECC
jgi:hypothetical protein